MNEEKAIKYLIKEYNFSRNAIDRVVKFKNKLLAANKKINLISNSTIKNIWIRHIIDSAQIIPFFTKSGGLNIVDLGTGAGFPGIIISIYDIINTFHVKLYEKSPLKRAFLNDVKKSLDLKCEIYDNVYTHKIEADIVVCRAFKKLDEIIKISREIVKKPHKIIILKGKSAQSEINKLSLPPNYSYKLYKSVTEKDSKIIIINVT